MGVLGARSELWLAGVTGVNPVIAARRYAAQSISFAGIAASLDAEQDRWFLWVPVFAGVGIGLYFGLPFEPGWIMALALLLAAISLRLTFRRGVLALACTGALLSTAVGFTAAKARVEWMRGPVVGYSKRIQVVHGWVELVERRAEKGVRYTLRVSRIEGVAPDATPLRVRVSSRYGNIGVLAGDALIVKAMLQPPPQPSEPNGYDFARQAWFAGVGGVGFSAGRPEPDPAAAAMPLWTACRTFIERIREDISLRITSALPGHSGIVTDAIVTGEQKSIPKDVTEALRDSGLSHILAISGLQITLMAGTLFALTRALLAAFPAVALRWPVKKIATAAGLAGATFYLLISGCGSATTRAYVMVAVGLLAVLLDRPALSMRNLAIAALCLIVPAPETMMDPSFQMSFSAVVALMAAYEWARDQRRPGQVLATQRRRGAGPQRAAWPPWAGRLAALAIAIPRETLAATTIATIAVSPYTLFTFHRLPVYGVLANVFAEPLFNLIIMPLVALVLAAMPFGLEAGPLVLVDACVGAMLWIAHSVSALPGAVVLVPQMPAASLAAITLGGAWLCLWRFGWRWLGLAAVALGMLLAMRSDAPDILIGREGTPVAIRLPSGELSAMPSAGAKFQLAQWLEADADGRDAGAMQNGDGFRCDGLGCTALVHGKVLAISETPASLQDDCAAAQIVIIRYRQPVPCKGPALVLDIRDLRIGGAHTIKLTPSGPVLATVAAGRGDRPWAQAASLYDRTSQLEEMTTPGWRHGAVNAGGRKASAKKASAKKASTPKTSAHQKGAHQKSPHKKNAHKAATFNGRDGTPGTAQAGHKTPQAPPTSLPSSDPAITPPVARNGGQTLPAAAATGMAPIKSG